MTIRASSYARQENDCYQTEPWATEALLKFFPVQGCRVWEAAAGNHLMADVLREHGAEVFTSDIKTYSRDHDRIFDFLQEKDVAVNLDIDALITNPPYGKYNYDAMRFANLALKRCRGMVALLLPVKFDSGSKRLNLFRDNPRFRAKIVLVDRIRWFPGTTTAGTEDHAWFVWCEEGRVPVPPRLLYAENGSKRRRGKAVAA